MACEDGGEGAADTERDVAETELEIVEVVDLGEERGDGGCDGVEGGVDEGVEEEDEGDVFFEDDAEGAERVGEVERWFCGWWGCFLRMRGLLVCGTSSLEIVEQGHVPSLGWDGAVADDFAAGFGKGEYEREEVDDGHDGQKPEDGSPSEEFGEDPADDGGKGGCYHRP